MSLDHAMLVILLFGIALAIKSGAGIVPALLIIFTQSYNLIALDVVDDSSLLIYFQTLTVWSILFSAKDYLLLTLFGFMRNTPAFIILMSFAVSCLFHQAILAQVLTHETENLTLFAIRPTFMKYVSVVQLATVYYIIISGSGFNGGKRVKSFVLASFSNNYRLLYQKSFKVKS